MALLVPRPVLLFSCRSHHDRRSPPRPACGPRGPPGIHGCTAHRHGAILLLGDRGRPAGAADGVSHRRQSRVGDIRARHRLLRRAQAPPAERDPYRDGAARAPGRTPDGTRRSRTPALGRVLFDEIIPATDLPGEAAAEFAQSVVERFRNPWLDHEWRVILTNQETKMRIRVVPLIVAFERRRRRAPEGLALACAAHLAFLRVPVESLAEASRLPDFVEATTRWMHVLEREGVEAVLAHD